MLFAEITPDHEALDCGPGCRQISFGFPPTTWWETSYDVSDRYVAYRGGYRIPGLDEIHIGLVDLDAETEYEILSCAGLHCATPTVDGETVVMATKPATSLHDYTIWTYLVGATEMVPLVRRWLTEYARPVNFLSLDGDTLAWYDSSIHPAGIYAIPVAGGEVSDLSYRHCICYLFTLLVGRTLLYEGFQTYWHNIWTVDLDTLEHRNLTNGLFDQLEPSWDGRWVVWTDTRNDESIDPSGEPQNSDIYGLEPPAGTERAICTHPAIQLHAAVSDGVVVWEDYRNATDPNDFLAEDPNIDLYMLDLATMEERQLTSLPGPEMRPQMRGRRVFYIAPDLVGRNSLFMIDLVEAGLVPPSP